MAFSFFGCVENDKGVPKKNLGEIYNPTPLFSWKTRSDKTGWTQTAYQLVVKSGDRIVWDSGKVKSNNSVSIASTMLCFWAMAFLRASAYSSPSIAIMLLSSAIS